jgi:hypothetical protein
MGFIIGIVTRCKGHRRLQQKTECPPNRLYAGKSYLVLAKNRFPCRLHPLLRNIQAPRLLQLIDVQSDA